MAVTHRNLGRITKSDNDSDLLNDEIQYVNEEPEITVVSQTIKYVTYFVVILLAVRFILALFGFDPGNILVNLVYTLTSPLVMPFNALLNVDITSGVARFELHTILAVIVYFLIGMGIVKYLNYSDR